MVAPLTFNLGQRHSDSETNTVVFTSQYDQINLSELEFVTCGCMKRWTVRLRARDKEKARHNRPTRGLAL